MTSELAISGSNRVKTHGGTRRAQFVAFPSIPPS